MFHCSLLQLDDVFLKLIWSLFLFVFSVFLKVSKGPLWMLRTYQYEVVNIKQKSE